MSRKKLPHSIAAVQPTDEPTVITRERIERRTTVIPAAWVSQRTCLAVLGIDPGNYLRTWREMRDAGADVVAAGKLRLARPGDVIAFLRARSEQTAANDTAEDQGEDDVAADWGLVAVGGQK